MVWFDRIDDNQSITFKVGHAMVTICHGVQIGGLQFTTKGLLACPIPTRCWVQGDTLDRVFSVPIESDVTIEKLKEAIQRRKSLYKDIAADSLTVFKMGRWYTRLWRADINSW